MTRHARLLCAALVLSLPACSDPIPLGPDLVACECQCSTTTGTGIPPSSNSCGSPNWCDPPCEGNEFCSGSAGCVPFCNSGPPPSDGVTTTTGVTLHVCVDSSDQGLVNQACANRCSDYANGSLLTCIEALLAATGIDPNAVTASSADPVEQIIIEECGTWLTDTLTGTCDLETADVGKALEDFILCLVTPNSDLPLGGGVAGMGPGGTGIAAIRQCGPNGNSVLQINGCPDIKNVPHTTPMPTGPSPQPASADVDSGLSLVSIHGPDVSPASAAPSGHAYMSRIGPIVILGGLTGTLPSGDITVKGHDVTLSDGFLETEGPVAGILDHGVFTIPAGKLKFMVTGNVKGTETSVEGFNVSDVVGHYSEVSDVFDLATSIDLHGLDATVDLELTFQFTNRPPQANAGPDQTIECSLPDTREGVVPLSAAQSVELDPGDHIATYAWTLGNQAVSNGPNGGEVSAHAGLGKWVAKLTTVDTHGSIGRDASQVTVQDTLPPVFDSVTVTPSCLWPANHKMVLLRLGKELVAKVHDGCDSAPEVFIKSVESSEAGLAHGSGSGNTSPDVVFGSAAACVRAERDGHGQTPRIYKITLAARDFEGHQSEQVVLVTVPHDQGKGDKCPSLDDAVVVADGDPACSANVPAKAQVGPPPAPLKPHPTSKMKSDVAGGCAVADRGSPWFALPLVALAALALLRRRRTRG